MDTSTVLQIIAVLDQQADRYNPADNIYSSGRVDAYTELRDHLQEYIESQLNGAENSTGE